MVKAPKAHVIIQNNLRLIHPAYPS
ncbi:hypothetical protein BsWGS_25256 [Bradybaena similaris]